MIAFQNVTKVYPPDHVVLRDISMTLSRGEFVILTGPAGSGKSLIFQLILRQEKPTRGQVIVFGRNIAELRSKEIPFLRRRIGFISQELKLARPRTVMEHLTSILNAVGIFGEQTDVKAKALLKDVGLENLADSFTFDLSRSQQQKMAIARALVVQPAIILADEPLSYLGQEDAQRITNLLLETNRQGTIVIWATQNLETLSSINKRILVLKDGGLTIKEPPSPVTSQPSGAVSSAN